MSGINSVGARADINQVLAQMKTLREQVQKTDLQTPELSPTKINASREVSEAPKFGDLLSSAVNSVNDTQLKSSQMATAFEQGDPSVTLAQVMVQSQKASVSFQALTQVRNKVVQAYQDIMKMPV
jgi:flagellar hook-basal body complex protein FliE